MLLNIPYIVLTMIIVLTKSNVAKYLHSNHTAAVNITTLWHFYWVPTSFFHLPSSPCFPGVLAATIVPGGRSEADSAGHRGEGDVRCVEGRHHPTPLVCNFAGQHPNGYDQCHLCRRAHEESASQVTNTKKHV